MPLGHRCMVGNRVYSVLTVASRGRLIVVRLGGTRSHCMIRRLAQCCSDLVRRQPFSRRMSCSRAIQLVTVSPAFRHRGCMSEGCGRLSIRFVRATVLRSSSNFDLGLRSLSSRVARGVDVPCRSLGSELRQRGRPSVPRRLIH